MRSLLAVPLWFVMFAASAVHAQTESAAPAREQAAPADEPAATAADTTESARAHFRLGVDFYRERNFRAALIEFQRAYADAPHYKLLYNLGQASLELQEYAGAIDYFTAYLQKGGEEIAPERRQEVEQSIRYLESRIARVTISSNHAGAEVYVDDTLVGRIPLGEPVRVGAGRHKFMVVAEGRPPAERMVDVAAQEQREIRLDLEDRQVAASAVDMPRSEFDIEPQHTSSNTAAIVAGVTTGVLGAAAITMTVLSALAQKAYKDELDTVTTKPRLDELRDDAETKAVLTDVAWGATLVSGIVTAVLILAHDDEPPAERAAGDAARARVDIGFGPTGFVMDGRF